MKSVASKLENAVSAICPDIWKRIAVHLNVRKTEEQLFEQLTLCLLSSQVSYDMAWHTNHILLENGLLSTQRRSGELNYESRLKCVLSSPLDMNGKLIRYRFPNVRSRQIASIRKLIDHNRNYLCGLVYAEESPHAIRHRLVRSCPGIGLKQSSMFLRNIGRSYDLAIIDRHVIDFMQALKLVGKTKNNFSHREYIECEKNMIQYSNELGYPVGCVDWAIWIVMRVAKKESYL